MTPPWNLVLSCMDDPDALSALAVDLRAAGIAVPGTVGPVDGAQRFAELWCRPHGLTSRPAFRARNRAASQPRGSDFHPLRTFSKWRHNRKVLTPAKASGT